MRIELELECSLSSTMFVKQTLMHSLQNRHLAVTDQLCTQLHGAHMVYVVYTCTNCGQHSYMNVQYSAFKTRATQYYSNCVNTSTAQVPFSMALKV